MYKPIPGRFKDYISLPKTNGYQSLHTAVIGPRAERMEIQIRTQEMHNYAEHGIAAHWKYKESGRLSDQETERFTWLRSLMEWQKDLKDAPDEFLSSVRQGLLPEDRYVYAFTPAGDVRELPAGATPVDFAYTIHTNVGNQCVGARVNGSITSLKYQIQNGDTIEIIKSKNGAPSKDWLNFVVTTKARHRIRQWFKTAERDRSISLGKEMLEKELKKNDLNYSQLLKDGELDRAARELSLTGAEDLFASVGFGKVSVRQVVGKLKPKESQMTFMDRMFRRAKKTPRQGIKVRGEGDVLVRFPGCCNPLPGEDIVGYITQGRGVTIHSARCKSLASANPDRRVDVEWDLDKESAYEVNLRVKVRDRPGVLAELSGAIADAQANITKASVQTYADKSGLIEFTLQVTSKEHLDRVFNAIRKFKWVDRVVRLEGKAS
jgi:GTP pyrophosphokinase